MSYNGKNYSTGDKFVIGGELVFEEDAKLRGSIVAANVADETGTATQNKEVIKNILVSLKNAGLMVGDDWNISIPSGITYENMATAGTAANSNKVTVTLENGVITVAVGGKIEDELTKVDHGTGWGKHYWLGFGIRTGLASDAGVKFTQISGMEDGKAPTIATLTADDDAEANSVGLASAGDIILYIKAEVVRENGFTFKLNYDAKKTAEFTVVIDESETD